MSFLMRSVQQTTDQRTTKMMTTKNYGEGERVFQSEAANAQMAVDDDIVHCLDFDLVGVYIVHIHSIFVAF